ncbi:MAG TPA: hypothetical protein VJ761_12270, partial [Ktedonobacteraceae bacterium]|nr:hypothetical protein [Ktedonobacteraceae bacterium]
KMGQYQQWLHYQEVDRHLKAKLETLETELAQLQDALCDTAQTSHPSSNGEMARESPAFHNHNAVIRLLAQGLKELTSAQADNASPNGSLPHSSNTNDPDEQAERANLNLAASGGAKQMQNGETMSPALMSWGRLPNLGPLSTDEASPIIESRSPSSISHPEIALLPEDMQAFFDEHSHTDPQHEIPWWLGDIASIDPESLRTNSLVQRWVERRGQLASPPPDVAASVKPEEDNA